MRPPGVRPRPTDVYSRRRADNLDLHPLTVGQKPEAGGRLDPGRSRSRAQPALERGELRDLGSINNRVDKDSNRSAQRQRPLQLHPPQPRAGRFAASCALPRPPRCPAWQDGRPLPARLRLRWIAHPLWMAARKASLPPRMRQKRGSEFPTYGLSCEPPLKTPHSTNNANSVKSEPLDCNQSNFFRRRAEIHHVMRLLTTVATSPQARREQFSNAPLQGHTARGTG